MTTSGWKRRRTLSPRSATAVLLTIGQLARRVGVRPSTVRYYESHGVLPAASRLPSGYRIYAEKSVATLRFIRHAQSLGITLKEAKELLALVREGQRPCDRVRKLAHALLWEIDDRIREFELLRAQLRAMLRGGSNGEGATATLCPMIESAHLRGQI